MKLVVAVWLHVLLLDGQVFADEVGELRGGLERRGVVRGALAVIIIFGGEVPSAKRN